MLITSYSARVVEDSKGNLYILAATDAAAPQVEVWKATDELNTQFTLVHNEELRGMGNTTDAGNFIIANRRSNSTPSSVVSIAAYKNDTWYAFNIVLTHFANGMFASQ